MNLSQFGIAWIRIKLSVDNKNFYILIGHGILLLIGIGYFLIERKESKP